MIDRHHFHRAEMRADLDDLRRLLVRLIWPPNTDPPAPPPPYSVNPTHCPDCGEPYIGGPHECPAPEELARMRASFFTTGDEPAMVDLRRVVHNPSTPHSASRFDT